MRAERAFQAVCWLPVAVLVVALWDAGSPEGWNAWAVAGAIGPPAVGASTVLGMIGVVLWIRARRRGQRAAGLLVATLVASSVVLWFLGRLLYLETTRGA